jgi:hypothetical protein
LWPDRAFVTFHGSNPSLASHRHPRTDLSNTTNRIIQRAGALLLLGALIVFLVGFPAASPPAGSGRSPAAVTGDTLTAILRPILGLPSLVRPGDTLTVWCSASPDTVHTWMAALRFHDLSVPLRTATAEYREDLERFDLRFVVPPLVPFEVYDLHLRTNAGIDDTARRAVAVIPEFRHDFTFVQVTDTHLPGHIFYPDAGWDTDTSEETDFQSVIDDINLIRPDFVLHTGDLVNSGELEEFGDVHAFSRSQAMLEKIEAPVFLVGGNHDMGGWDASPPPDGTARRAWWSFYGWPYLDVPPPGVVSPTRDYFFDYGPFRFVGIDAWINYDDWRSGIYQSQSFINEQLVWLNGVLDATPPSMKTILFYHYDFSNQINLAAFGCEMALWGHNHVVSEGNLTSPPYNLGLKSVCDGRRVYRVVHAHGDTLLPEPMTFAGEGGGDLRVSFIPPNNGNYSTVTATVTNQTDQDFDRGMVVFRVPADGSVYAVSRGTVEQRLVVDGEQRIYVREEFPSNRVIQITVSPDGSVGTETLSRGARPRLDPPTPNPFNPTTRVTFHLPEPGRVLLRAYDVRGRRVSLVASGRYPAGTHQVVWYGKNGQGEDLPAGVYLLRLETEAGESHSRAVLLR